MNQAINQLVQFLQQGISAIFRFVQLVWTWSFGQIVQILQSNWQNLPAWKIAVLALVILAIVYVLYKAVISLWGAAEKVLLAFVALLGVLITMLPYIVIAGLIAAGGGWVIQNVNF
jgi:type VI protein secretion system component VasF